jgi:hypothetical protein
MGRTIVDIDAQMEKRGFLCKCLTSLTFSVARFGNQAEISQDRDGGWSLCLLWLAGNPKPLMHLKRDMDDMNPNIHQIA